MVCPFCLHTKTDVFNSRKGTRLNSIWRRRRCPSCGAQFTTYESAEPSSIISIKNGKEIKPFSHTSLLIDLLQVCDHRDDKEESVPYLSGTIEQKLYHHIAEVKSPVVTPQLIYSVVAETLQNYDPVAYIKYIGKHQKDLSAANIRRALKRK